MKRILFLFILFLFFTNIFAISYPPDTNSVSLLFIGDIMQHDSQIQAAYDSISNEFDYASCFKYVAPIIKDVDIAIANLEVTFGGKPYKGYPQFSAPDELAYALKNAGINYLVTTNNHSYDKGKAGFERTIDLLDSLGFEYTGTFKDSLDKASRNPLFIRKKDFLIALINYSYGTNGIKIDSPNIVNLIDTFQIKNDLKTAKDSISDVNIVFLHWGLEYERYPNSKQKRIAEYCLKNGADLVIGSHPHVVQQIEKKYFDSTEVLIAYSLGNYVSNQRKRYTDGGIMFRIDLKKTSDSIKRENIQIDSAGYYLTWVYKKNDSLGKEFNILPVSQFEQDTSFIMNKTSRKKMQLFASDSRTLFRKNNKNVFEFVFDTLNNRWFIDSIQYLVEDTTECSYKIQFLASKKQENEDILSGFKEIITYEKSDKEFIRHMLGCFSTREEAKKILDKLVIKTKYKDAFIVNYKDGVRIQKKLKKKPSASN